MRLADFILDQMEAILQESESSARTIEPCGAGMSVKELRNHASAMLQTVAEGMRGAQSREQQVRKSHGQAPRTTQTDAGEGHGIARCDAHFSVEQLVSEYRALRCCVLRLWSDANGAPGAADVDDIIRFNEAIDELLAASVFSYAQAMREAAEKERQRKDQFLAMLAHELRNPLSPISAAASLLKMARIDNALVANASNIIARQVMHMSTLIDDLLDVSRVTRGTIELKTEPLDLRHVIEDAVEQVAPQIEEKHHAFDIPGVPDPITVDGDRKRLVQVVTNLLTNAAKYTPDGGRIRLNVDVQADQVAISVEDNGIGMSPDFVPHVFELFAQAERTSDRSSGGLGLGLALVKSLAELHRGKVACNSPGPGQGSAFTVWLPRRTAGAAHVERRRSPRTQMTCEKPLTIMVVDDNVDAARTLALLLQTAGHRVITEHEPLHALDVARIELPDVCVLDIGLPEIDGNEMARRLRAAPETAQKLLIALTGYCQDHDRDASLAAGFDHYMTKPLDIARLQSLLAARMAARPQ